MSDLSVLFHIAVLLYKGLLQFEDDMEWVYKGMDCYLLPNSRSFPLNNLVPEQQIQHFIQVLLSFHVVFGMLGLDILLMRSWQS